MDHCLRSGFYETAIKLARDSDIEVGFLHCGLFESAFEASGLSGQHIQLYLRFYHEASQYSTCISTLPWRGGETQGSVSLLFYMYITDSFLHVHVHSIKL